MEINRDYVPVQLDDWANADNAADVDGGVEYRGKVLLRGLPFSFAVQDGCGRVIRLCPGERASVAFDDRDVCTTVTFAHRVVDPAGPGLSPVGREDALYSFEFSDGERVSVRIRDGFEIAPRWHGELSQWGARPALALPDRSDTLPARYYGMFGDVGRRRTEVVPAGRWSDRPGGAWAGLASWGFYLWAWINPRPGVAVVRVELLARDATIEVGGLCLGFVDEHPLRPDPARVVVTDLPEVDDVSALSIEVDRGSAGYTRAVVLSAPDDPLSAWGDNPRERPAGVYARVSSVPSGTVRLAHGARTLIGARWSDLRSSDYRGFGSLRCTERGRNWVRSRIIDEATNEILACRVHFSSADGVPYQPYGHPHHVNSDLSTMYTHAGPDVRLGRTTYAYIDGTCEGWLPRGPVRVQVARGFDYQPVDRLWSITEDTDELTIPMRRLYQPEKSSWYSGDTHVHFVSSFGALREAQAEGVSVVHLLLSQWGSAFSNTADFLGREVISDDSRTILYASQENRQHFLGHLSLLGLAAPVMPWCTDGPSEAEMGAGLETNLADWADRCHAQGGIVVAPHFPAPHGEVGALVVTGRLDAVEMVAEFQERAFAEYYAYLNAGFRVPLAGGTDKMSNDVPIGLSRTYVRLASDQEFGFAAWCQGLRAGRSYMTSGPLLDLVVEGSLIGDTVVLSSAGGRVAVEARARCIFPMFQLELIHQGRVVAQTEAPQGSHELALDADLRIDAPGWLCIRVGGGGPPDLVSHRDEWRRAIMAHSSPVYIECGESRYGWSGEALQRMIGSVERAASYVTDLASLDPWPDVLHHHGEQNHVEFLLRPLNEARDELHRRLQLLQAP